MDRTILQVSDLLALVNQTLEYAYPSVVVEGEVASFQVSRGKFVFFDLKDDDGAVNCFMMAFALSQALEDGMRVQVVGQPRLTARGKFSLTVREVIPVGEGSIKRAFELLKARLGKEGLFDPQRKRLLPRIPQHVGVIASVESAGYADFVKILNHRWGGVEVSVANVQVQGIGAAQQIIHALSYFNQLAEPPEVLVIARGGGSADDLAIFNDEQLVRAIAASRTPTLVGVGHETDISLADLVADVRAATPSNAAQILVPDRQALIGELAQREHRLAERIESRLAEVRHLVNTAAIRMVERLEAVVTERSRYIHQAEQLLRQLDPKVVLQRGYSLTRDQKGNIVNDGAKITPGDVLTITTARAIIRAGVIDAKQI